MALIIKSSQNRFNISEVSSEDSPTNSSPEDNSDSPFTKRIVSEVQTPFKVGVGSRSAIYSFPSSGRGAHRVDIAAKDLSNINIHTKVSLFTIFLTIACCMFPLNQVELFGSGHFIQDDSSSSTFKGANERTCVTNQMTASNWFLQSPTSVFIFPEHHDVSRQSSAKVLFSELSLKALIIANRSVASIDDFFPQQRPLNHIAIQIFGVVFCSALAGSEQNDSVQGGTETMISDMLQYIVLVYIAFQKVTRDKRYKPNTSIGANISSPGSLGSMRSGVTTSNVS